MLKTQGPDPKITLFSTFYSHKFLMVLFLWLEISAPVNIACKKTGLMPACLITSTLPQISAIYPASKLTSKICKYIHLNTWIKVSSLMHTSDIEIINLTFPGMFSPVILLFSQGYIPLPSGQFWLLCVQSEKTGNFVLLFSRNFLLIMRNRVRINTGSPIALPSSLS